MEQYLNILSVLILISSFALMANKRIKSYIKTFQIQAVLIAIAAGIMGVQSYIVDKRVDIIIVCLLIVVLKVFYIPRMLHKTYSDIEYKVGKDFFFNIPLLVFACFALVVFVFYCISDIQGINKGQMNIQVVNSVSVVLIGFFFMISRRKAIGMIVGFLVIENGLFVTTLFATQGMPFIVDIGIFIDMITGIIIMGVMVFKINDEFDSIDINNLKNLKG